MKKLLGVLVAASLLISPSAFGVQGSILPTSTVVVDGVASGSVQLGNVNVTGLPNYATRAFVKTSGIYYNLVPAAGSPDGVNTVATNDGRMWSIVASGSGGSPTGISAGTYGDASHVAVCTFNALGQATTCSPTLIQIASGAVAGLAPIATSGSGGDLSAGSVSNAVLGNMVNGRIKCRSSAGTGAPEDCTSTQVKQLLTIAAGDVSGLGSMATQDADAVAITGGSISVSADPTAGMQVATKNYVDAHTGGGGAPTGPAGGVLTGTYPNPSGLASTAVSAGAYTGDGAHYTTFTVNGEGRLTAAGTQTISIPSTAINDSTTAGRALVTAANVSAQQAALSLRPGTDVQVYDSDLAAIAALTTAADKCVYFTGAGAAALYTCTAAGRALMAAVDVAAEQAALSLVPGTNVQAQDAELQAWAGLTSGVDTCGYFSGSGTAATFSCPSAGRTFLAASSAAAETALLSVFDATHQGLVPASGGSSANCLKGDGSWSACAAGGGGGDMLSANNLTDVASRIAAHDNLIRAGADIASAATTDLSTATGDYVNVTGTTTITGLGTTAAGTWRTVRFTGALALTYNVTSLILPGAATITTQAGDVATFRSLGSGNWQCVTYMRLAEAPATAANTGTGGKVLANSPSISSPSISSPAFSGTASGDVSGAIPGGAITNAKLATMANGTTKCRTSAGTGAPEDCSPTQEKALLSIASTDITDSTTTGRALMTAANAAAAQSTLGLVPGTNVQAQDAELSAVASLTSAADLCIYFTGSGTAATTSCPAAARTFLAASSASAERTALSLVPGTDVQAQDPELQAIASLTSGADLCIYYTGSGTAATTSCPSAGRTLLAASSASAERTAMGVVIGTDVEAHDADLTAIAGLPSAANQLPYATGAQTWALTSYTAAARTFDALSSAVSENNGINLTSSNIASASTVDLSTATGNTVNITGSTGPITSFGTVSSGAVYRLIFASTPTITYNATSMILPGATNMTVAASDTHWFVSLGSGNWKCVDPPSSAGGSYQPLDGELTALAGLTSAADTCAYFTGSGTASTYSCTSTGRGLASDTTSGSGTVVPLATGASVSGWTLNGTTTLGGTLTCGGNNITNLGDLTWKWVNNGNKSGASPAFADFTAATEQSMTINGTLSGTPTWTWPSLSAGQVFYGRLQVCQDASGNRTIPTWPSSPTLVWVGGTPVLTTTASACDYFAFRWDGTTVTGFYPSNASYLVASNNLSDLASASTARTNLGLGTAATQNTTAFLQPSNNLSDVASVSTARTNLGLGTSAVANLCAASDAEAGTSSTLVMTPAAAAAIWNKGTDNSGGATVTMGDGGSFNLITSTTAITAFAFTNDAAGRKAVIRFNTVRTLTNNSTSLILPTGANITTAAGDLAMVESLGSGNFRVDWYTRADGTALTASSGPPTGSAGGALSGTYPNPGLASQSAGTVMMNNTGSSAAPTAVAVGTAFDALTTKGAAIASATTASIDGQTGNTVHITGTTTITSFGNCTAGHDRVVIFDGALTLTYNGTSLITGTGANRTTAAGDVGEYFCDTTNNWRETRYQYAEAEFTDAGNISGASPSLGSWVTTRWLKITQNATITGTPTWTAPRHPGRYLFQFCQDSTGSRTGFVFPTSPTIRWAGGSAPTLTATASKCDFIAFVYDGTTMFDVPTQNF